MKKLIAILAVMIVLVGAVFAASGDKLKLKSIVGEVLPVYQIKDSTPVVGTRNGAEVTTGMDISVQDISWNFTITQVGEEDSQHTSVQFAKTTKTATLTITLGSFTNDADENEVADDSPKFTAFGAVDPIQVNSEVAQAKQTVVTVPEVPQNGLASPATVTLAYKGVNWADQDVATFTAKWTKDDTLSMGTYHATVTLTYSVL